MLESPAWHTAKVSVPNTARHIIMEAVRGGASAEQDEGDIAIDNIALKLNKCQTGTESKENSELFFFYTFLTNLHVRSVCF